MYTVLKIWGFSQLEFSNNVHLHCIRDALFEKEHCTHSDVLTLSGSEATFGSKRPHVFWESLTGRHKCINDKEGNTERIALPHIIKSCFMTYLPAPDINLQERDCHGHAPLLHSNCIYITQIEIRTTTTPCHVPFDVTVVRMAKHTNKQFARCISSPLHLPVHTAAASSPSPCGLTREALFLAA